MIFFFFVLVFLNLYLFYKKIIFLIFVVFFMICIGKRHDFKLFIVSSLMVIVFFSINYRFYDYNIPTSESVFEIIEVNDNYSIVSDSNHKYLIYNGDNTFIRGNRILFNGEFVDIRNSYSDFNNYLNKKGIIYEIDYYDYHVVDNSVYLNDVIVSDLMEGKDEKNISYLKLILFNEKDDYNKEFYDSFSFFSLTYLIAVSGFHINIFLSFFKKIFKCDFIGYVGVLFYLFLLNFSVSSYRAFLCNLFKKINKKLDFNLSNVDIVSLIGIVFIFVDPGVMFSNSFIFSFLSTFVLEIFKISSKSKVLLTIYIYLVNIPLVLFNYYELNLLTLFMSIVMSYPVSVLYVFSLIYLVLDKFYLIYRLFINVILYVFSFFRKFNLSLVFGKPSFIFIIIYYFLLFCFFLYKERRKKVKYLYLFFIIICLSYQYFKPYLNSYEQFYFLNVGQGDCMVFTVANSKEVVVLDTGGSRYKDIAVKEIIPFLKSKGVNKISKVIISHDDYDHNGALISLKNNFRVSEIIDYYVSDVYIGESRFINLNDNNSRDNDGSLVLYGKYGGYDLLLMGDASIDVEKNIANKIDNVDILKVGHHGSNTSSGEDFLEEIKGKVAIVSVGKNKYGHPHKEVIERLEKCGYIVLRTDENNDIGFLKNIFGVSYIDYFK